MKTRIAFSLAPPRGSNRKPYSDRPVGQNVEHDIFMACQHLGETAAERTILCAVAAGIGVTLARMARDNRKEMGR